LLFLRFSRVSFSMPVSTVRVDQIANAGRGVIASRRFTVGRILFSENPIGNKCFTAKSWREWFSELTEQDKEVVQAFVDNSSEDGTPTVSGKLLTNAVPLANGTLGVFATACLINHSCCPNAALAWDGDNNQLIVVAQKKIKRGEEVTIDYLTDSFRPTDARLKELLTRWRFKCTCPKCKTPDNKSDARLTYLSKKCDEEWRHWGLEAFDEVLEKMTKEKPLVVVAAWYQRAFIVARDTNKNDAARKYGQLACEAYRRGFGNTQAICNNMFLAFAKFKDNTKDVLPRTTARKVGKEKKKR